MRLPGNPISDTAICTNKPLPLPSGKEPVFEICSIRALATADETPLDIRVDLIEAAGSGLRVESLRIPDLSEQIHSALLASERSSSAPIAFQA